MLFKKLIRTIFKYKAQFISMIIMVALGVGVFTGFNIEWRTIEKTANDYFEQTNFADYRMYSDSGFSIDDLEKIEKIENISFATRTLAINVSATKDGDVLSLNVVENMEKKVFLLAAGEDYDETKKGIWLSNSYALKNNLSVGDEIEISYLGYDMNLKIEGLIWASDYLVCLSGTDQIMPDYSSYGYFYISPEAFTEYTGISFYSQINIIAKNGSKDEIKEEIENVLNETVLILSRDENVAYKSILSEMEEGKTMGSILPVLFLVIALLTMVTTMHRICSNERSQIGILKALGFRNKRILIHYTSFGFVIGVIGTIIGSILGFGVAYLIINPTSAMSIYFDFPSWDFTMPWFCPLILILIVAFLTVISLLSVKNILKGSASDTLRIATPKMIRKSHVSEMRLWNKLSFSVKWNLRDISRHKSRSAMTLFGIIGCMVLLVGGLGMKDTMDMYLDNMYNVTMNYNTKININDETANEEVQLLVEKYSGDWVSANSIEYNKRTISLEIYGILNDRIRFLNLDGKSTNINDSGLYICKRIADEGVNIGDIIYFSPYGSDEKYEAKVAGIIRSTQDECIIMSEKYASEINYKYKITSVYTNYLQNEIAKESIISSVQTKQAIIDSFDSFMELMNMMVFILVLAAIVLGIVVLYNLGVMSYTERYRELSTLKVVGFTDFKIGKILISQNMWITVLGIIIGFPAGIGVLSFLLDSLATEYELLMVIGPLTYLTSILLTFIVSLIVSFFVSRKNKKINMVESLKISE